jgi:LysR family glycine cleavage system transcriptional activator
MRKERWLPFRKRPSAGEDPPSSSGRLMLADVRASGDTPNTEFDTEWDDLSGVEVVAGEFVTVIEPVCSPAYLKREAGRKGSEELLRKRLLVSQYRRSDWDDWLAAHRLQAHAAQAERMSFSSSILTWQAALDGLEVAIGQPALLRAELDGGQLARPFGKPLKREKAHYLVRPEVQRESRKVMAFRDWLLESVGQGRNPT